MKVFSDLHINTYKLKVFFWNASVQGSNKPKQFLFVATIRNRLQEYIIVFSETFQILNDSLYFVDLTISQTNIGSALQRCFERF